MRFLQARSAVPCPACSGLATPKTQPLRVACVSRASGNGGRGWAPALAFPSYPCAGKVAGCRALCLVPASLTNKGRESHASSKPAARQTSEEALAEFRGTWGQPGAGRWADRWEHWKMPLCPLLPLPMLCCQKGSLHPQFGHQHGRGGTAAPCTPGPACSVPRTLLCPPHAAESQVRAVQHPDSFWHPSLDGVCSCCIFLSAGLFGHALVHSRHSGSNVSLFPIRKGASIWGGREGGLSSSF